MLCPGPAKASPNIPECNPDCILIVIYNSLSTSHSQAWLQPASFASEEGKSRWRDWTGERRDQTAAASPGLESGETGREDISAF